MGKVAVRSSPLEVLRDAAGPYALQVCAFVRYLEGAGLDLKDGITTYLEELKGKRRIDRSGRKVSYSPAWWNQQIKALKWSVRYLLEHSPTLTIPERWAVEQELKKLKRRAPKAGIAKTDRVPNAEELKTLEEKADPRLSLMIKFLEATSCRVSEMLGAEVGKARRGARITYLKLPAKRERRGIYDFRRCFTMRFELSSRVSFSCSNIRAMGTTEWLSPIASASYLQGQSAKK